MLYWWPSVKNLHIPMPQTEIIEVPYDDLVGLLDGKRLSSQDEERVIEAGEKVGYPLFLRTDMASAKHQWERTCFVPKVEELFKHIWALIDETLAAGMFGELNPSALVFREWLMLDSAFTAFRGLPISRERRYFVRNNIVECHHPYWVEEAIAKSYPPPSEKEWRQLLSIINQETPDEFGLLGPYAASVGKTLGGYWSVDFALDQEGIWYLIDMAVGERSWHPEHIKH